LLKGQSRECTTSTKAEVIGEVIECKNNTNKERSGTRVAGSGLSKTRTHGYSSIVDSATSTFQSARPKKDGNLSHRYCLPASYNVLPSTQHLGHSSRSQESHHASKGENWVSSVIELMNRRRRPILHSFVPIHKGVPRRNQSRGAFVCFFCKFLFSFKKSHLVFQGELGHCTIATFNTVNDLLR
jgi:hypothetical protein